MWNGNGGESVVRRGEGDGKRRLDRPGVQSVCERGWLGGEECEDLWMGQEGWGGDKEGEEGFELGLALFYFLRSGEMRDL